MAQNWTPEEFLAEVQVRIEADGWTFERIINLLDSRRSQLDKSKRDRVLNKEARKYYDAYQLSLKQQMEEAGLIKK